MTVGIIDYGMGNLFSVKRAFELCGAEVEICQEPEKLYEMDAIVLPGVGAFTDGMSNLVKGNWVEAIRENAAEGIPILGICLGMQLLATKGFEGDETEGLNLIEGEVVRFNLMDPDAKVPHVGWNDVTVNKQHPILSKITSETDFYFVHSYHFIPKDENHIGAITNYYEDFVSVIVSGNVIGTQFHPEKSGKAGFQLIRNFLAL